MRKYIFLLFIAFSLPSFAQKQVNNQRGFWLGYFNQIRITDKWESGWMYTPVEQNSLTAGQPSLFVLVSPIMPTTICVLQPDILMHVVSR